MKDAQSILLLQQFHPKVRDKFQAFIEECEKTYNVTLRLMSVWRSMEKQKEIYAVGRTVKGENPTPKHPMGEIISDAIPGSSYHNYGLAEDMALVLANGSVSYNFDYSKFAAIGLKYGITWGGKFPGDFKDPDHFEAKSGHTWHDLLPKYEAKDFIPGTEFVNI